MELLNEKKAVWGYMLLKGIKHTLKELGGDASVTNGQDISFESLENCMAKLRTAPRPVTNVFKDGIFLNASAFHTAIRMMIMKRLL